MALNFANTRNFAYGIIWQLLWYSQRIAGRLFLHVQKQFSCKTLYAVLPVQPSKRRTPENKKLFIDEPVNTRYEHISPQKTVVKKTGKCKSR